MRRKRNPWWLFAIVSGLEAAGHFAARAGQLWLTYTIIGILIAATFIIVLRLAIRAARLQLRAPPGKFPPISN
ncbi:MAG: hypothetical protein EXS05_16350 [Planctomycetaceae bacterium]|nr:hypothetical protein [Planctomycetaceae bacterium]